MEKATQTVTLYHISYWDNIYQFVTHNALPYTRLCMYNSIREPRVWNWIYHSISFRCPELHNDKKHRILGMCFKLNILLVHSFTYAIYAKHVYIYRDRNWEKWEIEKDKDRERELCRLLFSNPRHLCMWHKMTHGQGKVYSGVVCITP